MRVHAPGPQGVCQRIGGGGLVSKGDQGSRRRAGDDGVRKFVLQPAGPKILQARTGIRRIGQFARGGQQRR